MLSKRYLYCAHAQVHLRLLLASKSVLPVPAKFDFRVRVQCKDHFSPNNYNFNTWFMVMDTLKTTTKLSVLESCCSEFQQTSDSSDQSLNKTNTHLCFRLKLSLQKQTLSLLYYYIRSTTESHSQKSFHHV